jgi:hypothetical protein
MFESQNWTTVRQVKKFGSTLKAAIESTRGAAEDAET